MKKTRRPSRSNEKILFLSTVHTSSPWRPQLPLPKEIEIDEDNMESSRSSATKKDSSNKKWSFGGFFRKKKKDADTDSTSDDDRKAGFGALMQQKQQQQQQQQRALNSTSKNGKTSAPKKKRASKLIGAVDHIVFNPMDRYKETDSLNSSDRVPSIDSNRSTGSLDRKVRRDRAKTRIETTRNSSSEEEDSHSSLSRFRSDESLGNQSGSLSRRSRGARNERYIKRLSKDETGLVHGSNNSFEVMYINTRPKSGGGLNSSTSMTNVPQLTGGNNFVVYQNQQNLVRSPPIPPPRDPQRRLTVGVTPEIRPMSYAFDKLQPQSSWNRCVSDDKLWGPSNLSVPTPQRPSSVQPTHQRRFITRHDTENLAYRQQPSQPQPQVPPYKYMADVAPRSRRPIHIVENSRDNAPSAFIPMNVSQKLKTNEISSPISNASNFWKRIDQQEVDRRNQPGPPKLKPRSVSSSRVPPPAMVSYTKVHQQERPIITHESIADDHKSNSMPNYYRQISHPPPSASPNKYEEYIVARRNKTQPVSILDMQSLSLLKAPPEPPARTISKRNSTADDDVVKKSGKSANLEDAINELEAIYKSLKLCDEDLLDRAERRDISTPTKQEVPATTQKFSPDYDDDDEEEVGEPDIVLDDLMYRNLKHANSTLKIVEPQPPFGIPLGPIPPPPVNDYLKIKAPEKAKLSFTSRKSPDLVGDDLAYRNLRKDSGQTPPYKPEHYVQPTNLLKKKRAMRSMSANIYNLIHRDAAKPSGGCLDDYFIPEMEKSESLTDLNKLDNDHPNTLWLLKKNRREEKAKKMNGGGAVFNLPSTLNTAQSIQPFISSRHELKPPIPQPRQHSPAKSNDDDIFEAMVKEAKETSEKLGQDLIELRNEGSSKSISPVIITTPTRKERKNNLYNEIDEVSKAAKLCEDILKEVSNKIDDKTVVVRKPSPQLSIRERYTPIKDPTPPPLRKENKLLIADIDNVSDAAKVCEKMLEDVITVSPQIDESPKVVKRPMKSLLTDLDPESDKISQIAERCKKQLDALEKKIETKTIPQYDGPDYDNLNTDLINLSKTPPPVAPPTKRESPKRATNTIDLLLFNSSPDEGNDSALENSVTKQIALVEDIDKIIQEAAEVIKSSEILKPQLSSEDEPTPPLQNKKSSSETGKSSSATPNRVNSSSITSFNAQSSSDYVKSPSSEYQHPSDPSIKSASTTSYEVKSTTTPTDTPHSPSTSPSPLALTPLNDDATTTSQYNSSEELAMIFGMPPPLTSTAAPVVPEEVSATPPTDSLPFLKTANLSCQTHNFNTTIPQSVLLTPRLPRLAATRKSKTLKTPPPLQQLQLSPSLPTATPPSSYLSHGISSSSQHPNNYIATSSTSYKFNPEFLIDVRLKLRGHSATPPRYNESDDQQIHSKLYALICQEKELTTSSSSNNNNNTNNNNNIMSSQERTKLKVKGGAVIDNLIEPKERKVFRRMQDNRLEKNAEKENKDLKKTDNSKNVKSSSIVSTTKSRKLPTKQNPSSSISSSTTLSSAKSSTNSSSTALSTVQQAAPPPRPKSTPIFSSSRVAPAPSRTDLLASQNIRTTRASRLRAGVVDAKQRKVLKTISSTEDENGERPKTASSAPKLVSTKRLVPTIAVSVKQTLTDDDSAVLTITDGKPKLSHTSSSSTPSPRQERDKSSKRKSNLNRALNEEATSDDAAARRRRRRELGLARPLNPTDSNALSAVLQKSHDKDNNNIQRRTRSATTALSTLSTKIELPKLEKISLKQPSTSPSKIPSPQPVSNAAPVAAAAPIVAKPPEAVVDVLQKLNNEIKSMDLISKAPKPITSNKEFEEKFNKLILECDKKIESLTPIRDLSTPQQQQQQQSSSFASTTDMPPPAATKENNISAVSPLKVQRKSFEEANTTNCMYPQNHIVSILKKKDPNDSSSSSNSSPVTFSSSVVDTPTRTSARQGILKKRSSLDESRYSRSQSPDERGILVRNNRRNSLEDIQHSHGILKQSSYDGVEATSSNTDIPHGILKKKETPTPLDQPKHVSIVEAVSIAAAELNGTSSATTPRPILKKKYSSETEEIRPILKSSRKSSREESLASDGDDSVFRRPILKPQSPSRKLSQSDDISFAAHERNMRRRRSKSLEISAVSVTDRIRNMESKLKTSGTVPKILWLSDLQDSSSIDPVRSILKPSSISSPEKSIVDDDDAERKCVSLDSHVLPLRTISLFEDCFEPKTAVPNEEKINYLELPSVSVTDRIRLMERQIQKCGTVIESSSNSCAKPDNLEWFQQNISTAPASLETVTEKRQNYKSAFAAASSKPAASLDDDNSSSSSDKKTEKMSDKHDDDESATSFCGLVRKNSVKDRTKMLESIMNRRGDQKLAVDESGRCDRPRRHTTEVEKDWNAVTTVGQDGGKESITEESKTPSTATSPLPPATPPTATSSTITSPTHSTTTSRPNLPLPPLLGMPASGADKKGILKSKSGCIGFFPTDLSSELKNRLKKSGHASVANLKKSATTIGESTSGLQQQPLQHKHESESSDSEDISPGKNLAAALREVMAGGSNRDEGKVLSTSEGESSGGREISNIIKNSAIARRKKHNDGWVTVFS